MFRQLQYMSNNRVDTNSSDDYSQCDESNRFNDSDNAFTFSWRAFHRFPHILVWQSEQYLIFKFLKVSGNTLVSDWNGWVHIMKKTWLSRLFELKHLLRGFCFVNQFNYEYVVAYALRSYFLFKKKNIKKNKFLKKKVSKKHGWMKIEIICPSVFWVWKFTSH